MNDEAINKLVARLRDGTVKQCQSVLGMTNGERCCLGVACDVAIEMDLELEVTELPGGRLRYGTAATYLPHSDKDFFGFASDCGQWRGGELALMNDRGAPFAEIADQIEARPEGMFV